MPTKCWMPVGPFLRGELQDTDAFSASIEPFRGYMIRQTRDEDLLLFHEIILGSDPLTGQVPPLRTLIVFPVIRVG